jgi:hypothetical protein
MRTLAPLLVAVLLLAPSSPRETATACPLVEMTLADLVSGAATIVVGEVIALHDAAGESVAEVRVVELLKGEWPGDTLFYPVRSVSWDPEEGPKVGEQAILLLGPDGAFEGTRAFWKALDRLRGGRPFLDLVPAGLGRLPILRAADGTASIVLLFDLSLPPDVLAWLPESVDPDSAERVVEAFSLIEALRRLAETPGQQIPRDPADRSPSG